MDIFDALDIEVEEPKREWKKVSGFIKIGRVFTFKNLNHKRNAVGDWECVNVLRMLSDKEPDTKFIIISGCDLDEIDPVRRRELFPNENVFYAGHNREEEVVHLRKYNILETRECEDVYVVGGPSGTRNGNHDFGPDYKFICMNLNYTAPSYHWLNMMDVPTVYLITDNRYYPHGFDYYKTPPVIMGQFGDPDAKYVWRQKHIKGPDDPERDAKLMEKFPYDTVSAPIDTLWLYNRERPKVSFENRSDEILIVANQVVGGDLLNKRYEHIKKYFVDHNIPAKLVGKWTNEQALDAFKNIIHSPDGVDADTLYKEILPAHKYGVIFDYDSYRMFEGFKDGEDTWVVPKLWEYIYNGVIPIIIGYRGKYRSMPKQLMVTTPQQLVETVEWLNGLSNESKEAIIHRLLKDEYFDGSLLYNRINEVRDQYGLWKEDK